MGIFDNLGVFDFWAIGIIALVVIAQIALGRQGYRFRKGIIPIVCVLALVGNIATLAFIDRSPDDYVNGDIMISGEAGYEDEVQGDEDELPQDEDEPQQGEDNQPQVEDNQQQDEGEPPQDEDEMQQDENELQDEDEQPQDEDKPQQDAGDNQPAPSEQDPEEIIIEEFTITASANYQSYGRVTANPGLASEGDVVTLVAEANIGHAFERWQVISGNITLIDANAPLVEFVMPQGDVSVVAVFADLRQSFNVHVLGQVISRGIVSDFQIASDEVEPGQIFAINAGRIYRFEFSHWEIISGDVNIGNINSSSTQFTMPASDVTVRAIFEEIETP